MGEKKYWKSFLDLKSKTLSKALKQQEFSEETTQDFHLNQLDDISRRRFLALSAATVAIATTSCTNYRDKGSIVPYNKKPENVLPGKPSYYASTCTACSNHCGILIKTREGRPIKVDGNPDHPSSRGKICALGQASILNLYDPERIKKPLKKDGEKFIEINWELSFSELLTNLNTASNNGKEIAIVTKPIYSPSLAKLMSEFQKKFPTTKIYSYEFLESYARFNAWNKIYPNSEIPEYDFSSAKIVVSLESNFLANEGNFVKNIRQFSENRNVDKLKDFNRLYSIEGDLSLTGANADYRIPLNPAYHFEFLATVLNEILTNNFNRIQNKNFPSKDVLFLVMNHNLEQFSNKTEIDEKIIKSLVDDLLNNQGNSIIVAGDSVAEDVHLLAFLINEILGNTKVYKQKPKPSIPISSLDDYVQLTKKIQNGQVGAILTLDCNPVFHFPKDFQIKQAIENVPFSCAFSEDINETTWHSKLILPINHNFESWGDFCDGYSFYSTIQPVIEPIFGTYQKEDILFGLIDGKLSSNAFHKFLMNFWKEEVYPKSNSGVEFEQFWFGVLHDGVFTPEVQENLSFIPSYNFIYDWRPLAKESDWSLVIKKPYFVGDGKFLNNGWLLELPHPITKVTWDNYLAISENDAKTLNLQNGSIVRIEYNGKSFEAPVFIVPGLAKKTLIIEAGFGREVVNIIGQNVGFNPVNILSKDDLEKGYILHNIKISATGKNYKLASTVEHHSLNDTFIKDLHKERHIIQEGKVDEYKKGKLEIKRSKEHISIIPEIKYSGVKWAMVIDLNKCVGCGACVTACNVENNIPVVGKDQVLRGREMQWIRIDTYFSGTPDNPSLNLQPMLCQHCDDAPCENVCPVVATNHSPDGLNQMIYNRCVGTRYCSNNCPYKVRRFNFYDFRNHFANGYFYKDSLKLLNNPEVTVRSRGVMEKCTFCIQRITEARQDAIANGRELKGTDVKTACQEACPANAIIFGDMHDKNSELYYWRNHKLGYFVLEELNIKPNVTYIAKLRNKKSKEDV